MTWLLFVVCLGAVVPAGLRWLRVAQREHYLPGSVGRFSDRWWALTGPFNLVLAVGMIVGLVVVMATNSVWPALVVAGVTAVGPVGLSIRGTTSRLAWTARLIRVAVVAGILFGGLLVAGTLTGGVRLVVLGLMLLPRLIDLALLLLKPVERMLGNKWVFKAGRKLGAIRPRVVGITGSYGKTTTKGYVAHLLSGGMRVLPTPASFNNRMGLARAINENLAPGTDVFIAEMGTYGKGEIADLCSWVAPEVAAIVSIGPVHLERFKSEQQIVEAKSEILDRAEVGVICVDHPLLAGLAEERAASMNIIEVGTGERGRVLVRDGSIIVDGEVVGSLPDDVYAANLAVAVGIGLALGVDQSILAARFDGLPRAEHRLTTSVSPAGGFTIIDDTFNSNPEGARHALRMLAGTGSGRKVLVTPGMVELGRIQADENEQLAAVATQFVDDMVIVGRTNRAALERGSAKGRAVVTVVANRVEAVDWVRENLAPGDTVLYENDLPDHYP